MSTLTQQHATLITAPNPGKLSALEAAMMDGCNSLHEAVAAGDDERIASLRADLEAMVDRYEATEAEGHPHPRWAVPHQRALYLSAAGDAEGAIVYEQIALEHAGTARQREISLGNIAERCLRLGRYDEAVEYFLQAQQVAPNSTPIMLTGAQALYHAGFVAEANNIFKAFLGMPHLLKQGTDLTAYLDYETRLHAMAGDLPALASLLRRWEEVSCG